MSAAGPPAAPASASASAPVSIAYHAQVERAAAQLRITSTIRERSRQLLAMARRGDSRWFTVDDDFLHFAAREVVAVTRRRYPDLKIPYHSRWRHFEAGGVDRKADLDRLLGDLPAAACARAMIDLAVVSVLLDAGAGPGWKYVEPASGQTFTRSEGLGVASFHAFTGGLFSSDPGRPLQVDAVGLGALTTQRLALAFQVTDGNPLVGLDGRTALLQRLGRSLYTHPAVYGSPARPGGLFDALKSDSGEVAAHDILSHLLTTLSGIWPSGNDIGGEPLGDCWQHAAVRGEGLSAGWIPFHKLSQWMTYSLLEPFEWAGVNVRGLEALTGLPEYRNGGLMIDSGLLRLRDEAVIATAWRPGAEIIVEWRAFTVALLDEVAQIVRRQLALNGAQLPLACVLEGGTWAAGRALAQRYRGGLPPLNIASDGTVF